MTELLNTPTPSTANVDPDLRASDPTVDRKAGGLALAELVAEETTIMVDGREYNTNLPVGLDVFESQKYPTESVREAVLAPSKMDEIPAGEFTVSGTEEQWTEDFARKMGNVTRTLSVSETDKGKVISTESLGPRSGPWHLQRGTAGLMTALGYVIGKPENAHEEITHVPTPGTVKKAAGDLGVEVQFFPNHGYIPGPQYLASFRDGKYPASSGTSDQYKHDIEDDHLTAMVLGSEPLKDALRAAAGTALDTNDGMIIAQTSQSIDTLTATLRAVISSHSELLGEAYGKESGRKTLKRAGEDCGIASEVTEQILATAQANARKFGMPVKELN